LLGFADEIERRDAWCWSLGRAYGSAEAADCYAHVLACPAFEAEAEP